MDANKMSKCAICSVNYNRPVVLPCGHSFCTECIEDWAKTSVKKEDQQDWAKQEEKGAEGGVAPDNEPDTVSCPSCREIHQIPEGGAQNFTRNYSLSGSAPTRDWCEEREARARCRDCDAWFCSVCRQNHHDVLKKKKSHTFFTVEEVMTGDTKPLFHTCRKHGKELMKLYCVTCSEPCCHLGGATIHKLHECVMLEEQKSEFCEKTEEKLNEIAVEDLHSVWVKHGQNLQEQKKKFHPEIKNRKQMIIKRLDEQEDEFCNVFSAWADENQEVCDNIKKMEIKKEEIKALIEVLTPGEFHKRQPEIQSMLEELKSDFKNIPKLPKEKIVLTRGESLGAHALGQIRKIYTAQTPELVNEFVAKSSTENNWYLRGVLLLPEGKVAVCDEKSKNKSVKIFDSCGKLILQSEKDQFSDPWYLTQIPEDHNNIIIGNQYGVIQSWNIKTGHVSTLNSLICNLHGLSITNYQGNTVLVAGGRGTPDKLHLVHPSTGNIITSYEIQGTFMYYLSGHPDHDKIAVGSHSNKEVRMYQNSTCLWRADANKIHEIKGPCGVNVTKEGQVIVADYTNNRVLLLSETGELLSTLLTKDHVSGPQDVYYDELNCLLAVGEIYSSKIKLYSYYA